ncbi:hypothetical protein HDU67_004593 [Dinochytrium kinnereticum]|nr:hypothetical protein HDU67_004593 [Dinochytrium kinnereticum]
MAQTHDRHLVIRRMEEGIMGMAVTAMIRNIVETRTLLIILGVEMVDIVAHGVSRTVRIIIMTDGGEGEARMGIEEARGLWRLLRRRVEVAPLMTVDMINALVTMTGTMIATRRIDGPDTRYRGPPPPMKHRHTGPSSHHISRPSLPTKIESYYRKNFAEDPWQELWEEFEGEII